MPSDDLVYLWVWCPEYAEWKSVSFVDELMAADHLENTFPSEIPTPPKALKASMPGTLPEIAVASSSKSKEVEDPVALRKHKRFEFRLPITIIVNNQKFETHTIDISLGGVQVEDELPDWVAGYGSAIFTLPDDTRTEVICSVVEDQKIGEKFRLEILPSAQFDSLKDWLQKNKN